MRTHSTPVCTKIAIPKPLAKRIVGLAWHGGLRRDFSVGTTEPRFIVTLKSKLNKELVRNIGNKSSTRFIDLESLRHDAAQTTYPKNHR